MLSIIETIHHITLQLTATYSTIDLPDYVQHYDDVDNRLH